MNRSRSARVKTAKPKTQRPVSKPRSKKWKVVEPNLNVHLAQPDTKGETPFARNLRQIAQEEQKELAHGVTEEQLTPEQQNVLVARSFCQKLMKANDRYMRLIGSFITTRRMYVVFYRELQELLAKEENVPDLVEDYFVQSAIHYAAQPFNEHDLMQGFVDTVLPHIAEIVDSHVEKDKSAEIEETVKAEKERVDKPIPVGFNVDLRDEQKTLDRKKSIVLVGWKNAVAYLLDQITDNVLADKDAQFQVVKFCVVPPRVTRREPNFIDIALPQWRNCANTQKSLAVCMGANVMDQQIRPVDLIVVENLAEAFGGSYVGRPAEANAGDAHKIFRRWCDRGGAGFIGGLFTETKETPNIRDSAFEQLRTFAGLTPVAVIEQDENHYKLVVGHSLHNWVVPKAVLDHYVPSNIITPG
jgi:hypothetical protein